MRTKYQKKFSSVDGTTLPYQYWPVDSLNKKSNVVIFLHQGNAEDISLTDLIKTMSLPEYAFFTVGFRDGFFSENRDMKDISILVRDFYEFISQVKDNYSIEESNIIIVGEYISALVLSIWLHDYAPQIKGAILLAPTFTHTSKIKLYKLSCFFKQRQEYNTRLFPAKNSTLDGNVKGCATSFLDTAKRVMLDASAIYTPIIMLIDQQDSLLTEREQKYFYNNVSSYYKRIDIIDDNEIIANKMNQIIKEIACIEESLPSLLKADQQGKTKEEFDKLAAPETRLLKRVYWAINRAVIRHIGVLSNGIKLGLKHGFDSGVSLDYVYQNTPSGRNVLGKLLDKIYLNNRSWKGVRQRKKNLEELLLLAIDKVQKDKRNVNILDIAAGTGCYLFDFIAKNSEKINHVLMRDYMNMNVLQGLSALKEKQIVQQVDFEWGDAFSEQSLATLPKDRTIAIASGFYELFNDNQMIIRSLNGVAEALEEGGFLIFTTKIWNPDLEYMARVMSSHKDGQAWLLRRRYQLEVDQLMEAAGFSKVAQRIDQWGIFTVTLMKKR
ncbi:hypothetical protein DM558_04630 [Entomomonas moraniae]|uniref:Uncharacterized protein n=1 Tax=Entomomonas moraniae TaxID=2213226 RepID=A0A3S9XCD6_9GAMM|nr:class I SAM-dependent methyltransferase family protein [Entomomonas moraniae]AZS50103.1 hypothetical protein DM558_04630 [Entomomonas moraniae]